MHTNKFIFYFALCVLMFLALALIGEAISLALIAITIIAIVFILTNKDQGDDR